MYKSVRFKLRGVRLSSRPYPLSALCACSLIFAITACSLPAGGDEDKITLTFANVADAEQTTSTDIKRIIETYEAEHPNIRIKSLPVAYKEMGNKLVRQVQAGNPPDIAQVSGNVTHSLASMDALEPLRSHISGKYKGSIVPTVLRQGVIDNKLQVIPWSVSPQGLWFNKKLLKEAGLEPSQPPTSVDELMTALAAIKTHHPNVVPLGIDTTNTEFGLASQWSWMKTFGAQPFDADNVTADTSEMKGYLTWMNELAQKGYVQAGHAVADYRQLAANNRVAFVWDQPTFQRVVQATNKTPDSRFFETWGVTQQPAGPSGKHYSIDNGNQLAMFKTSEHKDAAWEFMHWLSTDPQNIKSYTVNNIVALPPQSDPPSTVAEELANPVLSVFSNKIVPTTSQPEYGQTFAATYSTIMAGVQQAMSESASIDTIAKKMGSGIKAKR